MHAGNSRSAGCSIATKEEAVRISGIKISSHNETPQKDIRQYLTALLSFLAGVYGLLFYMQSLDTVYYQHWTVNSAVALFCCTLWVFHHHIRRGLIWFYLALTAAIASIVFINLETVMSGLSMISKSFTGEYVQEPQSATPAILLLMAVISLTLFWFGYVVKSSGVLSFVTAAALLLGPLLGVRVPLGSVILLAVYLAAIIVIHTTAYGTGRIRLRLPNLRRLTGKGSLAVGCILLFCLAASILLVRHHAEALFGSVYEAEGFVYRTLTSMSGKATDPIQGGGIGTGNNYRTGAPHLEVWVSREPTDTIYLRGYGGGTYVGGSWIRSSDEALFAEIFREYPENEWSSQVGSLYYSMYNTMNGYMQRDEEPEGRTLRITHTSNTYETRYVPYWGRSSGGGYGFGGSYGNDEEDDSYRGYSFTYYELDEMDIDPENIMPEYEAYLEQFLWSQEEYMKQAEIFYTVVPEELLPRLVALCADNPQTDLESITAFIFRTLHSNATYTLTPGWAPINQDIVEHFLFERGRGYCVHFAATATLMYRLYDIPARYATGYMVSTTDFELQEDGLYHAIVTDESAHAWVEIFVPHYGWVPIEVTPAGDNSSAVYPGFGGTLPGQMPEYQEGDLNIPGQLGGTDENSWVLSGDRGNLSETDNAGAAVSDTLKTILLTMLVYSICLLPFAFSYNRLRRLQKIETMGPRALFAKYMRMLRFAGYPEKNDGMEETFPDWVAEMTGVPADETRKMIRIAVEAAFGPGEPDTEQKMYARLIYKQTADGIYSRMKWRKKLAFRYWKAFS